MKKIKPCDAGNSGYLSQILTLHFWNSGNVEVCPCCEGSPVLEAKIDRWSYYIETEPIRDQRTESDNVRKKQRQRVCRYWFANREREQLNVHLTPQIYPYHQASRLGISTQVSSMMRKSLWQFFSRTTNGIFLIACRTRTDPLVLR